ncbi:hypothetical protein OCU04_003612 [Sclerotinia nivalis]|uniref:Uncharacterized protein n=1 Tax=Sclerotinia nivalis TaxID=352851 RepID=A0A9X0ASQ0_9HELO|nr:hypothetical protein OCU04_003612 [Sclerotinia nivalis]
MHHHALLIAGLAALATANPAPQNIDFAAVNAAPSPALTGPAPTATQEVVVINPASASASGAAKATGLATAQATVSQNNKRGWVGGWGGGWGGQGGWGAPSSTTARATSTSICTTSTTAAAATSSNVPPTTTDTPPATTPYVSTPCATQPDGYGPKVQPDTVDAFLAYAEFASESKNAKTPSGYDQTFVDLNAAVTANTYLGLTTFTSYDVAQCGTLCDNTNLCTGFNIYVERDPSVNPSDDCPNPASITNYKCTLWGSGVDSASATNTGQYRDGFQVVITGSNGYSKTVPPPNQPGWSPPQSCGGGSKGHSHPSTCLGQAFFPGPYNPAVCAGYAAAQNAKNLSLISIWIQMIYKFLNYSPYQCKFFNSYMLKKNGKPMGTYCSLFTQSYSSGQATYVPGVSGSDSWTCESSYSYTISN